jgi:hypothetical protein
MVQEPDGNGRVIAVLGEKLDNVSEKIDELCRHYEVDSRQIAINTQRLSTLEVLATRPTIHCLAHDKLADDVVNLRLDMARMAVQGGLAGGGVVTVGAGILLAVGKALGWL